VCVGVLVSLLAALGLAESSSVVLVASMLVSPLMVSSRLLAVQNIAIIIIIAFICLTTSTIEQ